MDRNSKLFAIIFTCVFLFFCGYLAWGIKTKFKRNLSYEFSGPVSNVIYDVKGIPTVTVSSTEYYLSAGYAFGRNIEKGDTLKKSKGSTIYLLIKQRTGEKIKFNN